MSLFEAIVVSLLSDDSKNAELNSNTESTEALIPIQEK